ncbi:MAG: monofunctional biosynthetic peptidoglycan transglycosylase [Pseudomonadota bacterium]|nr:monofunctional biosynthetic peptidoglycan transglycosylase [Pseudomonadota bacterium]
MGRRAIARRLGAALAILLIGFLALSLLTVAMLRWFDPPTSSFMAQQWLSGWMEGRQVPHLYQEWVDWDRITPAVPLAVVAAEDQRFPAHRGFDLIEIENAWNDFRSDGRLRGASTISQQVAKNLFLWRDKSLVRKGLEGWFTLLIELTWPKRRILEIYLNIAQFSRDTYGVGAASWRYFDRPAATLTTKQAALLAAVLPNPERYRLEAPSRQVLKRAAWIRKQARNLGASYLDGL